MAYGHVPAPKRANALKARLYTLPSRAITAERTSIVAWPIDCSPGNGGGPPAALVERLQQVFNDELEKGVTYPQRGPMSKEEFQGYFCSYDLIVGVLVSEEQTMTLTKTKMADKEAAEVLVAKTGVGVSIPDGFFDRLDWNSAYGFSYYVKVSSRHTSYSDEAQQVLLSSQIIPVAPRIYATPASLFRRPIVVWAWAGLQLCPFFTTVHCVGTAEASSTSSTPTTKLRSESGSGLASIEWGRSRRPACYGQAMAV